MTSLVPFFRIDNHIESISKLVSNNPLIAISATKGTGKTIGLPRALAESGNKVIVSVPTSQVAQSLSAYQQSISPNLQVGYGDDDLNAYSSQQLTYVPTSHLRRRLSLSSDRFTDIIILDDAGSGSLDNYMVLALWKYLSKITEVPRLILMDVDGAIFPVEKILVYKIPVNCYPIEVRYHSQFFKPDDPLLLDETCLVTYRQHNSSIEGNILILLPDELSIESMVKKLDSLNMTNVQILACHNGINENKASKLYQETNSRKIIVSTPTCSYTYPPIGLVIDTMISLNEVITRTGGRRTKLEYITQETAKKHAFYSGQYNSGLCYRMTTEAVFNRLPKFNTHDIERMPLEAIALNLVSFGLQPRNVLTDLSTHQLVRIDNKLSTLHLTSPASSSNALSLTSAGNFVTQFPLGLRLATTLWKWIEKGYPIFPVLVILAFIDSFDNNYFVYPLIKPEQSNAEFNIERLEHIHRNFLPITGASDLETYLNIWSSLINDFGKMNMPDAELRLWCQNYSLNYSKLKEVINVIKQCLKVCRRLNLVYKIKHFETADLITLLRPILVEVYADRKYEVKDNTAVVVQYVNPIDMGVYSFDSQQSFNTIEQDKPKEILALITSRIQSDSGSFNVIHCALNL